MQTKEQLLCTMSQAAALLGISRSKLYQMLSAGQVGPAAILLGGKRMFSPDELRRWVQAGCVNRERWQEIKDAENE